MYVEVQLKKHTVKETFFLFDLGGVDLNLRVARLVIEQMSSRRGD